METAKRREKTSEENKNARILWIDWVEFLLAGCGFSDEVLDMKRRLFRLSIKELNITSMKLLGYTDAEIACQFGCHRTTIKRFLATFAQNI